MRVKVKLFMEIRRLAKEKAVIVNLPIGSSITDVVRRLGERFGTEFQGQMLDEGGNIHESLRVLVNGRDITSLQGVETKLEDGDVIAIFPPVAGGGPKTLNHRGL